MNADTGGPDDLAWAALDSAPDGVVMVDDHGSIMLVNQKAEELFGYDRSELLGRPVEDLIPESVRGRHRSHRTRYRAAPTMRAMGEGDLLSGLRRDGSEFPVEISLSAIDTSVGQRMIATVRDVTRRIEAESHIALIQLAIDEAADGLFICDEDTFAFTYVNARAAAMHGYTVEELIGMTPLHLAPHLDAGELSELTAALRTGEAPSTGLRTTGLRSDGSEFPVEINISRPEVEGARRSIVAVVRDITHRVEAAEKLNAAERLAAILADRERLARDLHDTVIQELFALGLDIQATAARIDDAAGTARLGDSVNRIDEVIRHVRVAIFGISARQEWGRGLKGEILTVARDAERSLDFEPDVVFAGPIDEVPVALADELLPTLREALSNVAKHAQARRVDVHVIADGETLDLAVVDDGRGLTAHPERSGGRGLANMAERAELLGGQCSVIAGPDGGTELRWWVPLPS